MNKRAVAFCLVGTTLLLSLPSHARQSVADDVPRVSDDPTLRGIDRSEDKSGSFAAAGPAPVRSDARSLSTATACFELHGPGNTWYIRAQLDASAYPFVIVGGQIEGEICDSPHWTLTGGSLGASLTIDATHTGTGTCATAIAISGQAINPSAYLGTFAPPGVINGFKHRTLFLGYNRPTCP